MTDEFSDELWNIICSHFSPFLLARGCLRATSKVSITKYDLRRAVKDVKEKHKCRFEMLMSSLSEKKEPPMQAYGEYQKWLKSVK